MSGGVVVPRGLGLANAVPARVLLRGDWAVSGVGAVQRRVLLLKRRRRCKRRGCKPGWELRGARSMSGGVLLSGGDD